MRHRALGKKGFLSPIFESLHEWNKTRSLLPPCFQVNFAVYPQSSSGWALVTRVICFWKSYSNATELSLLEKWTALWPVNRKCLPTIICSKVQSQINWGKRSGVLLLLVKMSTNRKGHFPRTVLCSVLAGVWRLQPDGARNQAPRVLYAPCYCHGIVLRGRQEYKRLLAKTEFNPTYR